MQKIIVALVLILGIMFVGQGCLSDNSDYLDMKPKNDPVVSEEENIEGITNKPVENTPLLCKDGIDNDIDGRQDCIDSDCKNFAVCRENSPDACTDGDDNDNNGAIDCKDIGCKGISNCDFPPQDTMLILGQRETNLPKNYYDIKESPWNAVWIRKVAGGLDVAQETPDNQIVSTGCKEGDKCRKVNFTKDANWNLLYVRFLKKLSVGNDVISNRDTVDLSSWIANELKFWIKIEQPMNLKIKLEYPDQASGAQSYTIFPLDNTNGFNVNSTEWQEVKVPLTIWSSQGQMRSVMLPFSILKDANDTKGGTFWLDDVRYQSPLFI